MRPDAHTVRYPRRRTQRAMLRVLGRALLPLLTRVRVSGTEHFPPRGPLLVVGNHVAAMDVPLMIVYAPWQIEILGPGDIPPPPALDAIARLYGYTAINRGNVDRRPLLEMLAILEQGGVVGLFPEGGIWDLGAKRAKRGVAWLSYQARVPILPIGFGGLVGALEAALRLKRPPLTMNVGPRIPPVTIPPGRPRKMALQEAATHIMDAVYSLIPDSVRPQPLAPYREHFELRIVVQSAEALGEDTEPAHLPHGDALCRMFYQPAILRIFARDLGIDVGALQHIAETHDPDRMAAALARILHYIREENHGFFTYRFGNQEGKAIEAGLSELHQLCVQVAAAGNHLDVTPVHRYQLREHGEEVVETSPGEPHAW
jgi:1-acyl-sn-glycerol-3-phosphate acyltransferase